MATAIMMTHELVDIIDLQPVPGEYLHCANNPTEPFEVFGVTVQAWHRYHAQRRAVSERWGGACECCGHRLRYAHVTQDESGEFHCFGRTCCSIESFGEQAARKMEYSQRIEQKKSGGFCATFNVPYKLWDIPRESRPAYARLWKGAPAKRNGRPVWKLSVWGDSFEECLANCVALGVAMDLKLS
jgi:hypothetical protein